jgi:hypothetical protein
MRWRMFTLRTARLVDLDYGRGIATSSLKEFVVELNPVDREEKVAQKDL